GSNTASAAASGGVATFSNLKIDTAGSYTLTATDGALSGATSNTFTISAGALSQLVFTTAPQSLTAGVTSGTLTVQFSDQFGNPVNPGHGTTSLTLSSTSGTGVFRDTGDTATITSLSIATNQQTASFKYRDSAAGTPTLTATWSIDSAVNGSQTETVGATTS